MSGKLYSVVIFATVFFPLNVCIAEEPSDLSMGGGIAVSEKPYRGVDSDTTFIPFIDYQRDNLFLRGTKAGYQIHKDEKIKLSAIMQWRFDGYEEDDSRFLSGMDDRDMTLDAGLELNYMADFGTIGLSWVADILSRHNGSEWKIEYSRRFGNLFNIQKLSITPSAGVKFLDSDLADYYYGVRQSEAAVSRPAYSVDSSVNYFTGVNLNYKFNEKWNTMFAVNYTWLDDEIHNSPIVSESGYFSYIAALIYTF